MTIRALIATLAVLAASAAFGQEVTLRHALDGRALDALATLTLRFNDEQKGKAKVVLEDVRGLENKQRLPTLALLDADQAMAFFDTRPRFASLAQAMKDGGLKLDSAAFYPQVADVVDDFSGKIQALPLALGLPVLYYNRDAFRKAGLDPDKPPRTWWEVQQAAGELFDHGYKCPLTSARFSWVHVENVSSQHGEPVVAKSGKNERLVVNSLVNVKHIALLASWHKSFYFHYFGPGDEGVTRFSGGDCAMLTGESSALPQIGAVSRFDVGVAALPHYDDVRDARPVDVLPDGAALWLLAGKKKDEAQVAARFVAFLLRPAVQKEWVRTTGYLPMTAAAMDALRGSVAAPAVIAAAEKRLAMPRQGYRSKIGVGQGRLREIVNEEIAFVWQNAKPAKEALDTAVSRANVLLSPAVAATLK